MKGLLITAVVVVLPSCFSPESDAREGSAPLPGRAEPKSGSVNQQSLNRAPATQRVVRVKLTNGYAIHWDNQANRIVADSLYQAIVAHFPENNQRFLALISDTTPSAAEACGTGRSLVVGDVAFLLIDNVKPVPYLQVFGMQWDALTQDCPYPVGMLDYVNNHRQEVRSKLEAYFTSAE